MLAFKNIQPKVIKNKVLIRPTHRLFQIEQRTKKMFHFHCTDMHMHLAQIPLTPLYTERGKIVGRYNKQHVKQLQNVCDIRWCLIEKK